VIGTPLSPVPAVAVTGAPLTVTTASPDSGAGHGFSSAIRKLIVEPAATVLPAAGLMLPIRPSTLPFQSHACGCPGREHDRTDTADPPGAADAADAVQTGTGTANSAANAARRTNLFTVLCP
jgi:hypothetical protein